MAVKKRIEPIEDDEIIDEHEDDEVKEPKTVSFFSRFKDYDKSYMITLYRKVERNKRVVLKEFENYTPSITEIQETYGAGTYMLYVNDMYNGKIGKLIDSCEIHLEGLTTKNEHIIVKSNDDNDFFSEKNLQKLAMFKSIFGNNGSSENSGVTDLILKMSENTNRMFNEMMKSQQESERRATDLMLKMSENNKSNLSELMETWSFFNEISGGKSAESSPLDRLLELAPSVIGGLNLSQGNATPIQHAIPSRAIPQKSETEIIDNIISKIPVNIKQDITEENKDEMITKFHALYKDDVTRDDVEKIINRILLKRTV